MNISEIEVYKLIKTAGNKGLVQKEINSLLRDKLKQMGYQEVTNSELTHILQKLVKIGKIQKPKKSQQKGRNNVYLLAGVEAHQDIVGDWWEKDAINFEQMNQLM